jgi:hypothetical protein
VKFWLAPWIESYKEKLDQGGLGAFSLPNPAPMDDSVYASDVTYETRDCQDSIGELYDMYFPSTIRSVVSTVLSSDIPNGAEVCHLICELGCDERWMDPSKYFLAAEVDCAWPLWVWREYRPRPLPIRAVA